MAASRSSKRCRPARTLTDVRRLSFVVLATLLLAACDQATAKPTGSGNGALDLMFQNRYAAAETQLKDQIKQHPTDARPLADYALLLNYETKQKAALDEAQLALKLAPRDGYVLAVLTRVEDWNNDITAAAATGAQAVNAAPQSALARAFYGEALADVGKYSDAQTQLNTGASLAKNGSSYERAEVERNWANYYRDRQQYPEALTHLKLAAGDQPNWVERLLELARFSIGRQNLNEATTYLQRATTLSPDDAGIREQLGEVALFAQDYAVAKDAYGAALRLQPRNNLDLKILGDLAVALDHSTSTALADERAAIVNQPSDGEAGAYLVAVLRYLSGDEAQARQAAQNTVAPTGGSGYVDLDKAALDRQAAALAAVNHYRSLVHLTAVGASPIIHQSALAHAFYTLFNGNSREIRDLGIHKEIKGGLGYTGDDVLARAEHFGYPIVSMAEVITHRSDPAGAVGDWIDSVYHRIPLLRADLRELGYGDAYLGPLTVQVMDMSYREAATGRIILYPAPDQTGVPVAFLGNEIPDPAPNAAYPIGYPITATFDRNANVKITSSHLRDPAGNDLPGISLTPSGETENSFAFLANTPLQPSTTYRVELSGTVNGVAFHQTWRFATVAAASPSPQVQQAG